MATNDRDRELFGKLRVGKKMLMGRGVAERPDRKWQVRVMLASGVVYLLCLGS